MVKGKFFFSTLQTLFPSNSRFIFLLRFAVFDVKFPKQVKGNSLTVEVKSYYTHAQTPYPAKIPQSGVQRVLYFGNHYIPSPYVIESQTTTLHANRFEDSTPLQPSNTGASQINYGPYSKVAPFSFSSNRVHAINNTPFLYVPKLIKDVEVSHWGNIAVEEKFEVKHEGAELKGTFSRVDYMHGSAGNSAREFVQILPKGAADVYYRDQIGNISSSHVRVEGDGSVRFEIEPRFVLFGGWKIDFYTGYNLPISSYLTNDGDNYSLTIPFHNIFEGTSVDEIEYRFTLPEGSSGIKVSSTSTITKRTEDKKFTYLDVSGRPVISFRAKNIISEHKDQVIIVNYTFSSSEIFKEPLLLVAGYFAFFLLTIFFFRFELNISK